MKDKQKELAKKFTAAMLAFEQAVRAHEIAGAQPPEDRTLLEAEYLDTKNELKATMMLALL